jgi:predicted dehydrogenase
MTTTATRELKIGVIGAGGRGYLARCAHQPDAGSRLVAGADTSQAVLDKFKADLPDALVTKDYRQVLDRDDIDAVFVTTPDFLHEQHALAALEAGKDVYVEKPMTITIEGCDRLLETAMRLNRKLYVGHNMRHMSFVLKMRELVKSGAIGEVRAAWCRHFISYGCDAYFKDWHAERSKSTSMLLQKAAHDLDVMHWICGGFTKRVNAMGNLSVYNRITDRHPPEERGDASWSNDNWPPLSQKQLNPIIDIEDLSMMNMEYDNGVMATYQQCHYTPDGWRNYTFIGTEGRIENFGDSPGHAVIRLWNRRTHYQPYGDEQFFIPPVTGGHGGADPSIVNEFLNFVRGECKATTSPLAARASVAAGCMATKSLRDGGKPYDITPLKPEVIAYFLAQTEG